MSKLDQLLRETGCLRTNEPLWTPDSFTKGVVVAEFRLATGRLDYRLIRFGNWAWPHGQSEEARADYKKRNHIQIAQGRRAPDYWAWYYLWSKGSTPWSPGEDKPTGKMKKGVNT